MFVVNFDFRDQFLPFKLLAINIPILITETITYPLQRIQTLLISQSTMITRKQTHEISLIIRNMISIQGFPKLLHGMRYSVDYMGTKMTTRFLLFQFLSEALENPAKRLEKWKVASLCYIANLASTAASQIAFNYQTIASSLPIDKSNRSEDVKIKLEKYTRINKFPVQGLKYTLPASLISTTIELLIMDRMSKVLGQKDLSYIFTDLVTAFCIFSTTAFVSHYAFQRQVQICKNLPERSIPYSRGLLGSLLRQNVKGMTLFGLYLMYFQIKAKQEIDGLFQKREVNQTPMPYRQ